MAAYVYYNELDEGTAYQISFNEIDGFKRLHGPIYLTTTRDNICGSRFCTMELAVNRANSTGQLLIHTFQTSKFYDIETQFAKN